MNKQTKISLETARAMYEQGGAAKQFALDNFSEQELTTPSYPKTWEECFILTEEDFLYYITNTGNVDFTSDVNKNCVNTKEQAEAILALTQLLVCRDAYRGEWKPIWGDDEPVKSCLQKTKDGWFVGQYRSTPYIFSFEKEEQAQAFLDNFKDLLEQVKPLFL